MKQLNKQARNEDWTRFFRRGGKLGWKRGMKNNPFILQMGKRLVFGFRTECAVWAGKAPKFCWGFSFCWDSWEVEVMWRARWYTFDPGTVSFCFMESYCLLYLAEWERRNIFKGRTLKGGLRALKQAQTLLICGERHRKCSVFTDIRRIPKFSCSRGCPKVIKNSQPNLISLIGSVRSFFLVLNTTTFSASTKWVQAGGA